MCLDNFFEFSEFILLHDTLYSTLPLVSSFPLNNWCLCLSGKGGRAWKQAAQGCGGIMVPKVFDHFLMQIWCLGTWLSVETGIARLMVGLVDLRGLSQS